MVYGWRIIAHRPGKRTVTGRWAGLLGQQELAEGGSAGGSEPGDVEAGGLIGGVPCQGIRLSGLGLSLEELGYGPSLPVVDDQGGGPVLRHLEVELHLPGEGVGGCLQLEGGLLVQGSSLPQVRER